MIKSNIKLLCHGVMVALLFQPIIYITDAITQDLFDDLEDFIGIDVTDDDYDDLEVDLFLYSPKRIKKRRALSVQQQVEPGNGIDAPAESNKRWYMEHSESMITPPCPQGTFTYAGCEDAASIRPVGCYPRDRAPPPKPCRGCSDHVHLAPGKDDPSTSITISYTLDFSCGKHAETFVMVGEDPNNLDLKFLDYPGEIGHYTSTACMAEDPAQCKRKGISYCHSEHFGTYISDWYHHVQTFGLEPNTKYFFQIHPSPCDESVIFHFTTPPRIGTNQKLRLAVVGDTGFNIETLTTFQHIENEKPDMLIIPGDITYPDRNHRVWDEWFTKFASVLSHTPLMVAPGNHDHDTDCCDYTTFKAFQNRFLMPEVQPAEMSPSCATQISGPLENSGSYDYGNAFYSVKVGIAHIIVLNTYTDLSDGSKQLKWLRRELKSVDRMLTPWLIVVAHASIYETFSRHKDERAPIEMKKRFERLFNIYGVNLFLSGHDHACEYE